MGTISLFVTPNNTIYIDNGNTNGILNRFTLNRSSGIDIVYINASCYGLFVDTNNDLYCSIHGRHQVFKNSLSNSTHISTTVAGTGYEGFKSDMLSQPCGIFVDSNCYLYVADAGNNRIQRFTPGLKKATTVAGDSTINATIKLRSPTGIILDFDGNYFIVDSKNNRIVGSGPNGFRCLVGCSEGPGGSNKLSSPYTLSFDSFGNMFVTDKGNHRIQKFLSANSCSKYLRIFFFSNLNTLQRLTEHFSVRFSL